MHKVTLDPATAAKLQALTGAVAVCDASGRLLGHFTPAVDRSLYETVEVPISDDELQRREREGGGRPLAEILKDLEQKA